MKQTTLSTPPSEVVVKKEIEKPKPTTAQLDKWIEDDDGNFVQDKSKSSTAKKR